MKVLHDPLNTISWTDIEQLCADGVSESLQFELKSDLPTKGGRKSDVWHTGGSVGEYARNAIAEEIVAFGNTIGGVVLVGIDETSDHPHRAAKPRPLPRIHDLARRLRQAVHDMIDPPLPMLEVEGIDRGDGTGVVVMRVASSRRKPHRHQANKEAYVRRADESVRIGMREIQELTLRSAAEATRVGDTIAKRRDQFRTGIRQWQTGPGGGLHFVGLPTTSLDLGRVVARPELVPPRPSVSALFGGNAYPCTWPAPPSNWMPSLRAVTSEYKNPTVRADYLLQTDGLCELSFFYNNTESRKGVFAGWLVAALAYMLNWIDAIRRGAEDVSSEFALAPTLTFVGLNAVLAEYGVSNFEMAHGTMLPVGYYEFPVMSVGARDEFTQHLSRFDEDLWNLAGVDTQETHRLSK